MSQRVLDIDWSAPPHPIPKACYDESEGPEDDPCIVEVPFKERGAKGSDRYLRFVRDGEHFVLGKQSGPELETWLAGFPAVPSVDRYVYTQLEDNFLRQWKGSFGESQVVNKGRWQFQAALQVGGSLERSGENTGVQPALAVGFAAGARYFTPKVLGPLGFGLGVNYWGVGAGELEDGDNLVAIPTVGLRPVVEFPFDFSLGPLLGFSEPLPSTGSLRLTVGAGLQANVGLPVAPSDPYFHLDLFNATMLFLGRPSDTKHPLGGSFLVGINPVGIFNGLRLLSSR
jgi:hypothetical protein